MVPIRGGKAGEGTLLIAAEADIDVNGESEGEGENHVPRNFHCAYSNNFLRSRALDSWAVAAISVRAHHHRR